MSFSLCSSRIASTHLSKLPGKRNIEHVSRLQLVQNEGFRLRLIKEAHEHLHGIRRRLFRKMLR